MPAAAMKIKQLAKGDAAVISAFYLSNAEHLRPWEPRRDEKYHSVEAWSQRLIAYQKEQADGRSVHFIAYMPATSEVLAICSLTNVVKDSFQACNMGYAVAEECQGKGVMKTLCQHTIRYAFDELGLNRVMANYMPRNTRSEALLKSLGFIKEGLAKNYLMVNGKWEDHVLTSLVNRKQAAQH